MPDPNARPIEPIPRWTRSDRRHVGCRVARLREVSSTNDLAISLIKQGSMFTGDALVAHHQTHGRGTRGRTWLDEPGCASLVSAAITPPGDRADPTPLALPPAAAIAGLLAGHFGIIARTKAPNDVLARTSDGSFRKICGILIEVVHDHRGEPVAVVGVGLNVNQTRFATGLDATSIAAVLGHRVDVAETTALLLDRLDTTFADDSSHPGGAHSERPTHPTQD